MYLSRKVQLYEWWRDDSGEIKQDGRLFGGETIPDLPLVGSITFFASELHAVTLDNAKNIAKMLIDVFILILETLNKR